MAGRLLQHREPNQGKPGARLVYDLADNLLGERSPRTTSTRTCRWRRSPTN
ncbi:hypothetical protein A4U88_3942 [Serratia marcescens]|uniref:hypothetical protein n=1 Tax=Serratia marcescens TaxID=615 RepID=UPI0007F1302D|nr:hypothetical protein [Serratia marcescens]ANM80141.1 hypothetical protein A4U88_3942 [Serratia marcescens]